MANLIAAGTSATTGTFTLASGEQKTLSLYAVGSPVPAGVNFGISIDGTGDNVLADTLNGTNLVKVVNGPGVFVVDRPNISQYGVSVGCDAD